MDALLLGLGAENIAGEVIRGRGFELALSVRVDADEVALIVGITDASWL